MLRCRDVADLASDYIDGVLPWSRRFAVGLHLTICRLCRRYLRQMRETVRILRAMRGEEAAGHEELARELFRSTHRK